MRALSMILLAAAMGAAPAAAREKPVLSWGKAGVSLDAYRADAVTCGRQGYYLDISGTEQVAVLKGASKQLEANEAALGTVDFMGDPAQVALNQMRVASITASSSHIVEGARPRKRIEELRQQMESAVTTCLTGLGYKQFRLTPEQTAHLHGLKAGTAERHAYLHSLGSNPTVLADQAV